MLRKGYMNEAAARVNFMGRLLRDLLILPGTVETQAETFNYHYAADGTKLKKTTALSGTYLEQETYYNRIRLLLLGLLPLPCFFLPLLENGFALIYLLLNPFGVLVKLIWKNGDGVDIPRDIIPLFISEIRGRIDFVELFSPIGFAIVMNDGNDGYYSD